MSIDDASSKAGVELKGGMYTFMSLRLQTGDMQEIDQAIADKVQQAPGFFKNTPVVVDLTHLEQEEISLDGKSLLDCIKKHALVPIVASIGNKSSPLAESIAIPLIEGSVKRSSVGEQRKSDDGESGGSGKKNPGPDAKPDDEQAEARQSAEVEYVVKSPMLITKPVRSGQQIYARETDLIIMGPVGPGAEVIADNNIHIYGPLRGRALCGVSGNSKTRIFCQSLEAELVSVAGNYRMLETIPAELRGKPAQIWLDNDRLSIEPL